MSYSKYHAKKVKTSEGVFDSQREYSRWCELKLLERVGEISDLRRQVKFVLIPSQRVGSKVIERECAYKADFVYTTPSGEQVVEDSKGVRTPEYIIKRKLMLYVHGIQIHEV